MIRRPEWTEALAVGSKSFVERIRARLGVKAKYRQIEDAGGRMVLREERERYRPIFARKNTPLSLRNTRLWDLSS